MRKHPTDVMITTTRRTDGELDTYFGGRANYLAECRRSMAKIRSQQFQPSDAADVFAEIMGSTGQADFDQWQRSVVARYRAALKANRIGHRNKHAQRRFPSRIRTVGRMARALRRRHLQQPPKRPSLNIMDCGRPEWLTRSIRLSDAACDHNLKHFGHDWDKRG